MPQTWRVSRATLNMDKKSSKVLDSLKPSRIILPMTVGLGVVLYLFISDDSLKWDDIVENVSNANIWWIVLALFALAARDSGYIYRIRNLTNKELSWLGSTYVVILWEFASALTPSVVGGTAIIVFIINKENIPFGKSLAYVMLTAVLDNLFFVFASIFVIFFGIDAFPSLNLDMVGANTKVPVRTIFTVSAVLIGLYTSLMSFGLFAKPQALKWLMVKATDNRFLKRFQSIAIKNGNDIILASKELRGMTVKYWLKAILSTIYIWSARYLIVNCLIAAFANVDLGDHIMIFSRHVIMWIVMLISPTPGSAGVAEATFPSFFGEFAGSFSLAVGLFWRLLTYYAYLIIGIIFLPRWVARTFGKKSKEKDSQPQSEDNEDI